MSNITVRTFLKDGTEVTGKPVIIPPVTAIELMKVIEPKTCQKEGEERQSNLKSASFHNHRNKRSAPINIVGVAAPN